MFNRYANFSDATLYALVRTLSEQSTRIAYAHRARDGKWSSDEHHAQYTENWRRIDNVTAELNRRLKAKLEAK